VIRDFIAQRAQVHPLRDYSFGRLADLDTAEGGSAPGYYFRFRRRAIEQARLQFPEAKAVFVTSPTYNGVTTDLKKNRGDLSRARKRSSGG